MPTTGRVARNESLFREVNERIVEFATVGCATRVEANLAEYGMAREQPTRFLVAPGHVHPEHERIVTTNNRFAIVEKLGIAGEIATDEAD